MNPTCTRLLFALSLLAASTPLRAGDTAADPGFAAIQHGIRQLVRKEMEAQHTAGLSLALVDDQRVVWAEGFGFADRARRLPASADTLYSVGSLSQLFTAAAALQLAEQGAIDLDAPLRRQLPEFSIRTRFANSPVITPRHLLTHHAGLPAMHFKNMWTPKPEPLAAFVARLRDEYVAFPPGHVHVPSFPGYTVLGRLIETQCGQPFAACLQERLLAPLGMTHSTFSFEHAERAPLAMHYWSERPVPSQTVRDVPAAGLTSSITELTHFVRMLFGDGRLDGKVILKPRSVTEMLRAQNTAVALDLDNRVGMPWRLSGVRLPQARSVAWYNNQSPFSRGRILLAPEHKLGVIVLTNSSGSTEAVEKVSERLMELMLQQHKPLPPAESRPALLTAPSAPPRHDEMVGHYATILGLISVSGDPRGYHARMIGKTLELKPQPEGLLAPEYRFLGLIPIPISVLKEVRLTTGRIAGHQLAIAYYRNQAFRLGEKITPQPLPAAWHARLGEYRAVETDPLLDLVKFGNVSLAYTDGLLHFRYRVPGWLGLIANIPVRPVSDTELVVEGTGWLMGETVHVDQRDGREVLRYSGYEFRRVGRP
jgi:CubicO group peptidase (beta-lactamase class C family)